LYLVERRCIKINNFFKRKMEVLIELFWKEGLNYANYKITNANLTGYRKFRAFYGVSPEVCGILWNKLTNKPSGSQTKHLLWCLLFLKRYNTEHVNAALVDVDEKTFRVWTWRFIKMLSELKVVSAFI